MDDIAGAGFLTFSSTADLVIPAERVMVPWQKTDDLKPVIRFTAKAHLDMSYEDDPDDVVPDPPMEAWV